MIVVLGIGGTFQIGFQISTITYMSQVGKDAHGTLVNESTESPVLPEAASLAFTKALITVFSYYFPPAVLFYHEEQSMSKCCKQKKREICKLLLIEQFLRRHTLTRVASISPKIIWHKCLLQWFHLIFLWLSILTEK